MLYTSTISKNVVFCLRSPLPPPPIKTRSLNAADAGKHRPILKLNLVYIILVMLYTSTAFETFAHQPDVSPPAKIARS
jgi:hypothetical protein